MSWIKKVFTDFQTVIDAAFLNGIQDQVIADETDLANKVDKVTGKGLSTQDFTTALKNKLQALPMAETLDTELDGKVDKVEGKGLSTNDYTNAEKQRVADSALQTDLDALDDRVDQIYNGGVLYDTASGSIASFSDGADSMPVKKLVAQIEPVQDLHGYENPWPAGGGKNKFGVTVAEVKANSSGTWSGNSVTLYGVTFTLNSKDGVYVDSVSASGTASDNHATLWLKRNSSFEFANQMILSAGIDSYCYIRLTDSNNTNYNAQPTEVTIPAGTYTSAFISVMENHAVNGTFYPMIRLATETNATFAPYSNECPISGWTGAEITGTGKNLIPDALANNSSSLTENGATLTVSDGVFVFNGTSARAGGRIVLRSIDFTLPAGTYYFSKNVSNCYVQNASNYSILQENEGSFTLSEETTVNIGFNVGSVGTVYTNFVFKPQIERGSSKTSWQPYTGNQISVTFPSAAGTVYGATMTLNPDRTGTLVVDMAILDLGTLTYVKSSTIQNGFVATDGIPSSFPVAPSSGDVPNWLCSQYKVYSNSGIEGAGVDGAIAWRVSGGQKGVIVRDSNYAEYYTNNDMASFKAAMSGVQLVYEVVAPITYPLTASEVSGILTTLYGTNNIWADCGDVTVTAPRDTKLYIDGKITQAIAAALNA